MKEVSISSAVSILDEIESCSSLIKRTWVGLSDKQIDEMVLDAFNSVSRCQPYLFGSNLLKLELSEMLIQRYILLKQDFMTLFLRDFDGQHQFIESLLSGLGNANSNLNRNLKEHFDFEMESEINKIVSKYEQYSPSPDDSFLDDNFSGHDFMLSVTPAFHEFISYDYVSCSIDQPSPLYMLSEALLTQAKLSYSHNNAVEIMDTVSLYDSEKFSSFPIVKLLPKSVQFLISKSDKDILVLDVNKSGPVIERLNELSLKTGPFINGGQNMDEILKYMQYMPQDESTGSLFSPR